MDPRRDANLLTFKVGETRLALRAGEVAEVARRPTVTRVPHAPTALEGVANLRGQVTPVVSLAALLGEPPAPASSRTRVLVLDRAPALALQVDEIAGLGATDEQGAADRGGLVQMDDGAARLLDLDALLAKAFAGRTAAPGRALPARASDPARTEAALETVVLAFDLAGQAYALPLEQVSEVLPLPADVAALPRTDAAMLGVMRLRGEILPLASLRVLLGLPAAAPQASDRVVVASLGDARVGLAVDRLRAIVRAPESAISPVPAVLNRGAGEARIEAVLRRSDGGLISILSPERLFREESVAQILADGRRKAETMEDAQEHGAAVERFLVFRLADEHYGLPLEAVQEVARLPERLTRAPRAPAFVAGVMNLRGQVIPVIDQRQRFGVAGPAPPGRRVVIARVGELIAGFAVDAVSEILPVASDRLAPTPELTAEAGELFDRIATLEVDGRMVLLVNPRQLLDRAEADLVAAMTEAAAQPQS